MTTRDFSDKFSYRMVVGSISLSAVILSVGTVVLAFTSGVVPEQLVALGVASFSMLGGLLAPSPRN